MRVCLFTDTLGDVNGVSRFIRNIAEQSQRFGRELHALTSTRFECPVQPNIHNLRPRFARPMPGYPQLDLVLPPTRALHDLADRLRPDVVHVSTPGPVGLAGRRYAIKRGLPLLGTYHTDFPAYIDHLFHEPAYTWCCAAAMRRFYRPFVRLFTRSAEYAAGIQRLGIPADHIIRLLPGIDTDTFHTRHRNPSIWSTLPRVRPNAVKVLYVGRVSVEKNLPMLAAIWPRIAAACIRESLDAQLIIVGDGPYRASLEQSLADAGLAHTAAFLGFRHGAELSAIYASSDLFIFPSTTDTLGQVVMESQSAGLPVIVTDQGGPSEVVDDGLTGYVLGATSADYPRWVDSTLTLIRDPTLRARMGRAGHDKIQPMSIRQSFEHFWQVHQSAMPR